MQGVEAFLCDLGTSLSELSTVCSKKYPFFHFFHLQVSSTNLMELGFLLGFEDS